MSPSITPDAPIVQRIAWATLDHAYGHLRDVATTSEMWTARYYAFTILRACQAIVAAEGELQAVLAEVRGESCDE